MPTYDFKQVDAFTGRPFLGNPVAVVLGGDDLTDEQMQKIANWTNLSETTFLCRPTQAGADYLLRIFTPTSELPFAGHPTIGSAHAALEAGIVSKREFVMECGAGLLRLRVDGEGAERRIFVEAPKAEIVHDFSTSVEALSAALGAAVSNDPPPVSVRNGPVWLFCHMESGDAVAGLRPDMTEVARLSRDFVISGPAPFAFTDGETAVKIRCFAPAAGITEDPVTGSANEALPAYLARYGLLGRTGREYVSSQGRELGRDGRVFVRVLDDEGRAEIGGHAVTVVDGKMTV
jgi:PhzF family phenazine biosynthesis protein